MKPSFRIDDLDRRYLLDLTDADALAGLFGRLGFRIDRLEHAAENLGIVAAGTRRPIRRIERIARQGDLPPFEVYLFELSKLTLTHTRTLVKAFRDRVGFFLLVLTSDWQRLDFVYVERQAPEAGVGNLTGLRGPERVRVRPRILSVDRRRPHRVGLRVLRHFRWTSEDSIAHDQKMLSAYAVADWSEELFNNRALFSDYYLKRRLPEDPSWAEDPEPLMREIGRVLKDADQRFAGKPVSELRRGLLAPVLKALGFGFSAGGRAAAPRGHQARGFRLYDGAGASLVRLLDIPWNRYLDGKDPKLDPERAEDNPAVRVIQAFETRDGEQAGDWIILTNGRLWRLYGRRTHSRATNYYEIDLPELFLVDDPAEALDAFRYFSTFFGCRAFERRPARRDGRRVEEALVDRVLIESQEYAKELGERLKETVFEEVFPELAQGFLRSLAREPGTLLAQDELDAAYRGTLALLYRILFLLYAEARDLLPVHEVHDYLEISLKRIREEVAEAAGSALSARDQRLKKRYGLESFELYERLQRLFRVIDEGDPAVNVPAYNGGLFLCAPRADDRTAEAEAARFLQRARVDDRTLTLALDRLARAEETKRIELVFIDYRSLGVRQLGSIYEGLLEFRLRVASEDMAVVSAKKGGGKKSEKVVPLAEARKKKLAILRLGRGKEAAERILRPGEVYLENDKGERKSTGSYYTPDFVVEYLVARTLGPILTVKLDALRPEIRKAQAWQRKMVRMAEAKGERPDKYVSGPAVDGKWRRLVDDFFDLKVLDPAMGSGHFLVEAVDFVTEKMLELLAGFYPWNPVLAYLESTRRQIVVEMERHEILIPEERLTDVHLLKRHVLKRCIYGVDVNPMAVELAKVSLWLDCFTLGAPLSFLDHHLRCGNSLLGVTIDEVRHEIEGKAGENSSQLALFTSRFEHLKQATAAMAMVGAMADVTSEQVRESRSAYRSATNALAQYHRLLDVWCSRWFVEPPTTVTVNGSVAVKKRKKPVRERVLQYLKAEALETYFTAPEEAQVAGELAKLEVVDREYLQAAADAALRRGFFHWEIEFPEVFYRQRPGTTRQMERAYGREFDAVVGNPPWVRQESFKELKPALKEIFKEVFAAEADVYVFLAARALEVLARGGRFGMILQNKWFKTEYATKFRSFLRDRTQPLEVVDFGHAPLFPDADTFPCTLLVLKPDGDAPQYDEVDFVGVAREDLPGIDLADYGAGVRTGVPRKRLRKSGWELLPKPVGDLMEKIRGAGVPLREYVGSSPLYGIKTGFNEAFLIDQATRDRLIMSDPCSEDVIKPFLRGENIRRWCSPWTKEWIILLKSSHGHDWAWSSSATLAEAEDIFFKAFPSLHSWMVGHKARLKKRQDKGRFWWELRSCDYYSRFEKPKILYQEIQYHSRFSLDRSQVYCTNKIFFAPSLSYPLVAILNSSLIWWFLESHVGHMKDEAYAMQGFKVEKLPIAPCGHRAHSIENDSKRLIQRTETFLQEENQLQERITGLLDVEIPRPKIEGSWRMDEQGLLDLARRISKRALTASEKKAISSAFLGARRRLRTLRREICEIEVELHHKVFDLYGLTAEEVALVRKTAPPRDPLTLAEEDLRLLSDD